MVSLTRRRFLQSFAAAPLPVAALAAPERGRVKITDIRVMVLQGPRTYTLVKALTDSGAYGIGEAYGSPAVGVKEGVIELRPYFIGKDPLEIEALMSGLGPRAGGSLHAASGIEIALWDLAGKILSLPVYTLLGGKHRDSVRVYHTESPRNMLERSICDDWAQRMKSHAAGWTAFKVNPPRATPKSDRARDEASRLLTSKELRDTRIGMENCRNAVGEDYDLICQCGGDLDVRTAIQLAAAVQPVNPLWIEDAMPPDFSDSWTRLTAASQVPIGLGDSAGRRHDMKDFILRQGCDIVQVDVRNTGGLLEAKKIADLADLFYMPVAASCTGGAVAAMATAHLGAAVRDFLVAGTIVGLGNWMDDVIVREGPLVKDGRMVAPAKPGLGVELNRDVVRANLARGEKYWE